jgi:hypothetical protein
MPFARRDWEVLATVMIFRVKSADADFRQHAQDVRLMPARKNRA